MSFDSLMALCWDGAKLDLTRLDADAADKRRRDDQRDYDEYCEDMRLGSWEAE